MTAAKKTAKPAAKRKPARDPLLGPYKAPPKDAAEVRRRTAAQLKSVEQYKGSPGYPMIRALVKLAALGPFHFEKMP